MANVYWFGGTGNWSDQANHWSNNSGNVPASLHGSVPGTDDDVVFDSLSHTTNYTVTVDATSNCQNITVGAPLSGKATLAGFSILNIYGNLSFTGGTAGIVSPASPAFTFKATSGTKTIDFNGIAYRTIDFSGSGGTFQLTNTLTSSGGASLTLTAGTFDANGQTVSLESSGQVDSVSGAFTFFNLTRLSGASVASSLRIVSDITVTGTLTLTGETAARRVLVKSGTAGSPVTITAANVSITNTDFEDITGAGAGDWTSGTIVGDAGGNTGITMTAAADQHWTNVNGGNWSLNTNWTSRVPLPQDNVFMDCAFGTSKTVTADHSRLGKSVDWTGATWTTGLTWTLSTTTSVFGSLTMINNLTLGAGTTALTFEGRDDYTFTSNALTFEKPITLNAPTGTLSLGGDLTLGTTRALTITAGELSAVNGVNNYAISTGTFVIQNALATLTLGSATHLLTGTGFVFNHTAGTISASTGTLKITDTSNTAITFSGLGKTYNNLWFSRGTSTAANTITGSNIFADFKDDGSVAHQIKFTNSTNQTVSTFTVNGTAGNLISLRNSSGTTHATLTKSGGGTIYCGYLDVDYLTGSPDNTWYMTNSTDGGHNTTIYFPVAYSLAVTLGEFILTGVATTLLRAIKIATAVGNFALTGIITGFNRGWNMICTVESFVLTGISTSFYKALKIATLVGSFALTGVNAVLSRAVKIISGAGQFILNGANITISGTGSWLWAWKSKNTTSFSNLTKHLATFADKVKNTTTFTNSTKNTSTFTNKSKNTATWTNKNKS